MNLQGKTVLVTGGTDGIGAQLIRQLRDKGASVIAHGRNPERIAATRELGFEVIEADLANQAGIDAVVAGVGDRPLDLLINNAGVEAAHDFRVEAPELEVADRAVFVNLNAPIHLTTRLMPNLKTPGRATVVMVSSGLAIAPRAGGSVYCATKAALKAYTQALRYQFRDTGLHFLEALPPMVDTRMTEGRRNKKMSPEECARQIIAGIERDADEVNVGMVRMLKLVHSISPALARRIMITY